MANGDKTILYVDKIAIDKISYTEPPHKIISEIQYPDETIYDIKDKNALNKSQITNCLLEVPQRIKLALENGKMHLYKGSVLTYGDGSNLTIEEDVIEDQFVNTTRDDLIMVYDTQRTGNKLGIYIQGGNVFSQDTQPTTTIADSIWLDTANNKMMQTHDKGVTWYEIPIPIGVCSVTPYVWKSLDQVFNGLGYIGQCAWVDKGVKCLFADGRNADGTCKNIEFTNPELTIVNLSNQTSIYGQIAYKNGKIGLYGFGVNTIFEQDTKPSFSGTYALWFDTLNNEHFYTEDGGTTWNKHYSIVVPNLTKPTEDGSITSFKPKQPFRAVDYNDKAEIASWSLPSTKYIDLTLGATGSSYTAPANGWVQAVCNSSSDSPAFIEVNTEYASSTGTRYKGCWGRATIPVTKGRTFDVYYGGADFEIKMFRFTYAIGSESEV